MLDQHIRCLVALGETLDPGAAAQRCGMEPQEVLEVVRLAEHEFARALAKPGPGFAGFTAEGDKVLDWARMYLRECNALRHSLRSSPQEAAIAPLLARRSVSPKRLGAPGPDAGEMDLILQAALRAPDHGGLHPWRVIEFGEGQRTALADCFEAEKLRRDPLASESDRRRSREHATRPPSLLAFVVAPRARSKIPVREQWLAAGAALCNLLNASHQLGFGAIMLSGERCFDAALTAELGLRPEESLAGFISLGRVTQAPPSRRHPLPAEVWSRWQPPADASPLPAANGPSGNSLEFE